MLGRLAIAAAAVLVLGAEPCVAAAQLDGTWEGVIKIDKAEHAFVDGSTEEKTRIVIDGAAVHVFVEKNGKYAEIKPGKFQISSLDSNAVISGSDKGANPDSEWVDTVVYAATMQWNGTLLVEYARVGRADHDLGLDASVWNGGRRGEGEFTNVAKP